MERFIVGTAENVEAEYGATEMFGSPFVVFEMYNDEPQAITGYATEAAARAAVKGCREAGAEVEYLF